MKLLAKFTHPTAGYTPEAEKPDSPLVLNQFYEVATVSMGQSYTSIYLRDFPNRHFNSVSFDFYHDDAPICLRDFPEYNPYYSAYEDEEEEEYLPS